MVRLSSQPSHHLWSVIFMWSLELVHLSQLMHLEHRHRVRILLRGSFPISSHVCSYCRHMCDGLFVCQEVANQYSLNLVTYQLCKSYFVSHLVFCFGEPLSNTIWGSCQPANSLYAATAPITRINNQYFDIGSMSACHCKVDIKLQYLFF